MENGFHKICTQRSVCTIEENEASNVPFSCYHLSSVFEKGSHRHLFCLNGTMPAVLNQEGCWFKPQPLLADILKSCCATQRTASDVRLAWLTLS